MRSANAGHGVDAEKVRSAMEPVRQDFFAG
jgi:hypothetical protein